METFLGWLLDVTFEGGGLGDAYILIPKLCFESLSVISPKQLPKLRELYNAVQMTLIKLSLLCLSLLSIFIVYSFILLQLALFPFYFNMVQ
ncbi:hypothetical protein FCV25MIE_03161 [Fagus crenata]